MTLPKRIQSIIEERITHSIGHSETEAINARYTNDRRVSPRYNLKFAVAIQCNGITFTTFTKNISTSGVALEATLPESFLGYPCLIFIYGPDASTGPSGRKRGSSVCFPLIPKTHVRNSAGAYAFGSYEKDVIDRLNSWITQLGQLPEPVKEEKSETLQDEADRKLKLVG